MAYSRNLGFMVFFSLVISLWALPKVHAAQVTLAWEPSDHPEVAGYCLYYGYASGNYQFFVDVGNRTSYTLSGLREDQTYYLAATVYDAYGNESSFSDEVILRLGSSKAISRSVPLETGEVFVDDKWKRIAFSGAFSDPVVVAKSLSAHDVDPGLVRLRNVNRTGFEIRIQEWDYQDGDHGKEAVAYLVMERGRFSLPDGTLMEAGTVDTISQGGFEEVDFSSPFSKKPIVIASLCTAGQPQAATVRVKRVRKEGFFARIQKQESSEGPHGPETISFIAWEPSSGCVDGMFFEVGRRSITHRFRRISFSTPFMHSPMFLADMQTANGGNAANIRWRNKDQYGVDVQIDEEQSSDKETRHVREMIGYLTLYIENEE